MRLSDYIRAVSWVTRSAPVLCAVVICIYLALAVLPALSIYANKLLINEVAAVLQKEHPFSQYIFVLVGVQALITTFQGVGSVVSNGILEVIGQRLRDLSTQKILIKVGELAAWQAESQAVQNQLKTALREGATRHMSCFRGSLQLVQALVGFVSVMGIMWSLGGLLTVLVCVSVVPSTWVALRFTRQFRAMMIKMTQNLRFQSYLSGLASSEIHAREMRSHGAGTFLLGLWTEEVGKYRKAFEGFQGRRSFALSLTGMFTGLVTAAVTAYTVLNVVRRGLTIGDFTALIAGVTQLQMNLSGLLSSLTQIFEGLVALKDFDAFFEIEPQVRANQPDWVGPVHQITFDQVSFVYPGTQKLALKTVSFDFHKGQLIAIVGPNGAGKSTLIQLLSGTDVPTEGCVRFNGQDTSQFSMASIMEQVVVLRQDFARYQATVAQNVALADRETTNQIQEALEWSGARWWSTLALELETPLGYYHDGAARLSGGQWQQLALARTHYKKASIYLYDEPSSALDVNAEYRLMQQLLLQKEHAICIVVTHRMSSARLADWVVVVDQGRIVESGHHDGLVAHGGLYAQLYQSQAQAFEPSN